MTILFSFGDVISSTKGGTERVASLIATYLQQQGHQVMFLVTEEVGVDNVEYNRFYMPKGLSLPQKGEWIRRFCQEQQVDIIINEAGTTDDIYFLSKEYLSDSVKVITCIHFDIYGDLKYFYSQYNYSLSGLTLYQKVRKIVQIIRLPLLKRYHTRNRKKRYRYLALNSDYVVVPANQLVEEFKNFTGFYAAENIIHIPNPNSVDIAEETVFSLKRKNALYVGRLSYEKRVDRILMAWDRIAEKFPLWHVEIVGSGADEKRLKKLVQRRSISRVSFLGHQNDMKKIYEKSSILLLSSDFESFSMVLLEGLSNGCYPVIFDFPAAEQILAHDNWGTRLSDHSVEALSNAMCSAIKENRSNMSSFAEIREYLDMFSIENVGVMWNKLIQVK